MVVIVRLQFPVWFQGLGKTSANTSSAQIVWQAHPWCCACKRLEEIVLFQAKAQETTTTKKPEVTKHYTHLLPNCYYKHFQPKHLNTLLLGSLQPRPSNGQEWWMVLPNTHTERPSSKPTFCCNRGNRMMHLISV